MSIYFSDCNVGRFSTATYFNLPAAAAVKGANVAATVGLFFQFPEAGGADANNSVIMARQSGGVSGNDVRFNMPTAGASIGFSVRNLGSVLLDSSLTGLTPGVKYLLLFIVNPANVHVIAAPVDGSTPLISSTANTSVEDGNFTTFPLIERIGGATGASNIGWVGPLEHCFMCTGVFPESGGIPDNALIVNLATGAQDIGTFDAQLTGGAKRFWYPMRHSRDLADAYGLRADLTRVNEALPTGLFNVSGRQLRPEAMRPADALWCVSNASFATAGDAATARADVPIQGGTYVGISPAAIQARLVREDGTDVVGWTVVDPAPAAGVWAAGVLPSVLMGAGIWGLDLRAVNGGGTQIGDIVSGGVRGVGLHLLHSGSSQSNFFWTNGAGMALPSGIRLVSMTQSDTTGRRTIMGSIMANGIHARRGVRQAAIEWNTLYPGVPCQFSTVSQGGTVLDAFITGGVHVGRWAALAARLGVRGPYIFAPMGHSSGADADYEGKFDVMMTQKDLSLGPAAVNVLLPVSRYKGAGTDITIGNAAQVHASRRGMRNWALANPSTWGSSFSVLHSNAGEVNATSDPHTIDTSLGQGRGGAIMAWAVMSAMRAVPDEVVGIVGATGLGTSAVTLTINRVSNALTIPPPPGPPPGNLTALLASLAAATGGETISLAPGNYGSLNLTHGQNGVDITFPSMVTITAADPSNPPVFNLFRMTGAANLTLDKVLFNYTFVITHPVYVSPFRFINCTNVRVINSVVDGDLAIGVSAILDGYGWAMGLNFQGCQSVTVNNTLITKFFTGLTIGGGDNHIVTNNQLHSLRGDAMNFIGVATITIEGNYIHNFNRATGSGDHSDMIQFWIAGGHIRPSSNITIRGNVLDIGTGDQTQSIFMTYDSDELGLANTAMFYQNVLIENNVIINGHLHGITIEETVGLTIRNNTILHADGRNVDGADGSVEIPRINTIGTSTGVFIERNVTGASTFPGGFTVTDNVTVQDQDALGANYYGNMFTVFPLVPNTLPLSIVGSTIRTLNAGAPSTRGL